MQPLYIIKIGGNLINDEAKLKIFLSQVALISERKIIIHGGGKLVDELAAKLGIEQKMVDGRRITDADTLQLATMVYAGLINKKIVALLQSYNNNAIGLSGADNNCIQAKKRANATHDFGFVGDIVKDGVNAPFITELLEKNIVPIFCSITHDNNGQLFNTNADTMACAVAVALSDQYDVQLNFCFDKKGVLKDVNDETSVIGSISLAEYKNLLTDGIISKGMIPKLENAFNAIKGNVKKVVLAHSDDILNIVNGKEHVGTHLVA